MRSIWALVFIIVIAAGITCGYLAAPKYQPPNEAGQGRLRKRAEQFYRALRVMDYAGAARLMTPARQYGEPQELRLMINDSRDKQAKLKPQARELLEEAAQKINADALELRVDGNWALVGGRCEVPDKGGWIEFSLENTAWLCRDGDWWQFSMTQPELAAYGNPPDFIREVLLDKDNVTSQQQQFEQALSGEQPAAPAPGAGVQE